MANSGRYLRNEEAFKADAYAVLKSHFKDRREFERYYRAIPTAQRDEFLRVSASYRYLAKHGDWKIKVRGVDSVVGYLTNSYKLVAVFSLVESLSNLDHIDFYQWLTARNRRQAFPIVDLKALDSLYSEYKASYGAIRRCVAFFSRLPVDEQRILCGSIVVNKKPTAEMKKLAEHLYNLRSGFVHKAEFAHEVTGPIFVVTKGGVVRSTLTVTAVFRAFELGLLAHFAGAP